MDFIPKVEEAIIEEEEPNPIIDDVPNNVPEITEHDIFNEKPKLVIKEVIEPEQAQEIIPDPKPVKKKRVLTEEHKAKLAEARVKALETRRRNSAMKKEKKNLEKAIKDKELEDLRAKAGIRKPKKVVIEPVEEVFKEPEVLKEPEPEPKPVVKDNKQYYTQEDLEKASLNAIMGYEKIRKTRKQKKQEELKKTEQERKLKQEITGRVQPLNNTTYGQQNYWDNCY